MNITKDGVKAFQYCFILLSILWNTKHVFKIQPNWEHTMIKKKKILQRLLCFNTWKSFTITIFTAQHLIWTINPVMTRDATVVANLTYMYLKHKKNAPNSVTHGKYIFVQRWPTGISEMCHLTENNIFIINYTWYKHCYASVTFLSMVNSWRKFSVLFKTCQDVSNP